jgi:hypothetical protein
VTKGASKKGEKSSETTVSRKQKLVLECQKLTSGTAERKRQDGIKTGEDRAPKAALTLLTGVQYGKIS